MPFVVTRPVGGITINEGREVLRLHTQPIIFATVEDAVEFCTDQGIEIDRDQVESATADEVRTGIESKGVAV